MKEHPQPFDYESSRQVSDTESFLLSLGIEPTDSEPDATAELPVEIREKLLAPIDVNEQETLRLRFGLDRGEPRSYQEVGIIMGVDPDVVRETEMTAMNKLRLNDTPGNESDSSR